MFQSAIICEELTVQRDSLLLQLQSLTLENTHVPTVDISQSETNINSSTDQSKIQLARESDNRDDTGRRSCC